MSATRLTFASFALGLTLGAPCAFGAPRLMQEPRNPLPGQLSPDQRAMLDRAVDHARAALEREPNAPDLLDTLSMALWARATRDPDIDHSQKEQLLREGISAETSALKVRPDYVAALVHKERLLQALIDLTSASVQRTAMIAELQALRDRLMAVQKTTAGTLATAPSAGAASGTPGPAAVRVGGTINAPAKTKDVRPVYPPDAQAAGIQGVVIVEAVIDTTGHVANAQILRSIPILDEAALDAVRQWEYEPTLLNGEPVNVIMTVTVNFQLK